MNDDTPTILYPIADGPDPAVTAIADNIGQASGGAVTVGLAYGVTSHIPNELTDPYTMTHRMGLGIDLDAPDTNGAYIGKVAGFFREAGADVVEFREECRVHVTVTPGKIIDLAGFPKPTKKKPVTEEDPTE